MAICEQSIQGNSPTSTCFAADFLAKASRLQDGVSVSEIQEALSSLKLPESLQKNGLRFYSWRMSSVCYRMTAAGRLIPSSPRLLKWGIISNGWCLTANTSESPNSEGGCILSDILIRDVPERYFLSAAAMRKILSNLSRDRRVKESTKQTEIACTQCAGSGGWGGKTGLYFIDMNADPVITDVARCITARQDSGVSNHRGEHSAVLIEDAPRAILTPDRETVRQQGRRMKEPNEAMFTITAQDKHGIYHKGRIRKLMPIECWRLQGFTDEQFYKAQATGLKDGHLYKMAGNAVSVPVISAIGQRLYEINHEFGIVKE